MKAIWNNQVIAESDNTVVVEGNHYFPPESVKMEYLKSGNQYTCPWKQGTCDYYDVAVGGKISKDGAWMYPQVKHELAKRIEGRFAFWQGVEII